MPRLQAAQIEKIAADLLRGAGVPADEAAIVAKHSVEANLTGHDSHGIIQIPNYINRVEQGHIVPGASIAPMASRAAVRIMRCCCGLPASPTWLPAGKRRATPRGTPIEAVIWGCTDIEMVETPMPSTAFCTNPTDR